MDPRVAPLYEIFKLNSRLMLNCVSGMDEGQARWRPSPTSNSAAFVAAHLVDSRHYLAKILGLVLVNPLAAKLEGARNIDEIKQMPNLEDIRAAWKEVTGSLRERLKVITAEELERKVETPFPIEDRTTLGVLTFLIQHDSYHLGQLGFLRKQAGLEAMSYS